MKALRVSTAFLCATAIATLLASFGGLEIQVGWRDNDARAIDFFGKDKKADAADAEPFWKEDAAAKPMIPTGVPASFAELAERASPGVVNIATSRTVVENAPRSLEEFFFGMPFGGNPHFDGGNPHFNGRGYPNFEGTPRKVSSLGSGFVISEDGFIVTNNHVIEDVDKITVVFDDESELDATIVGRDPKTDIALIRVETDKKLFALPLGNSSAVRPGEWVVAIGNPFGLEHTVTAGIISAKHRVIGGGNYDDYIQTDAAINPGNSGGPLLNLAGEVIGMNTAINPNANTIGFAVPIDMAKAILPQLRASGQVTRGWLGVMIQKITPELAKELNLESESGALVSKVVPNGPAAEAGIERYDVIVAFDDKPIEDLGELPRAVAETPVDKTVEIVVVRDGERKTLNAKVGKLDEPELGELAKRSEKGPAEFGLAIQDLNPELARQLGLDSTDGVLITSVKPGSPADDAQLRRGDVILEVDRTAIEDVDDLRAQLDAADDGALLLIRRGDSTVFVPIKRSKS
jgi:serine protease Do